MIMKNNVRELLMSLNEFKCAEPDELHPRALKESAEGILESLGIIFIG